MSDEQTGRLLACFMAGTPARQAADVAGVNRNTARLCYHHLREAIADQLDRADFETGDLPGRNTGANPPADALPLRAREPGALRVVALLGLIERDGRIHIVPLAEPGAGSTPLTRRPDAIVCSDESASSAAPNDVRQGRLRIVLCDTVANDPTRRRAVRDFWRTSAKLLRRFNGVPRQHLYLYLKECEWRFNGDPNEVGLDTLRAWYAMAH